MIYLPAMEPYLLIALVLVVLFCWWKMMSFTFQLIESAHDRLRSEEARDTGSQPTGERESR